MHGYPLAEFKKLLRKAIFSDKDFLYILGDVIDRSGDGGVKILCWLLSQPNVQLILGNHEAMLLSCAFVFEEITNESLQNVTSEKLELLNTYMQNGGDVTLRALQRLKESSPETMLYILDYLRDAPLYETVSTEKTTFCSFMRGSVILIKTKNCPAIPLTISCGPGRSFRMNILMMS